MTEYENSKSDDQLEELLMLTEQMQEELDQKDRTIEKLKMQIDESLTLNEKLNSENKAGNIQALKNDLRKTKELLQSEKEKTQTQKKQEQKVFMMKKFIKAVLAGMMFLCCLACVNRVSARDKDGDLVVIIDPGHGGRDSGAVQNGLTEKELNWNIATSLKAELETYEGVKVYLTKGSGGMKIIIWQPMTVRPKLSSITVWTKWDRWK